MLNKELFNYGDKLYWIYRKVRISHVKSDKITALRDFWGCDLSLKETNPNGVIMFLVEIPEAEIIEDKKTGAEVVPT